MAQVRWFPEGDEMPDDLNSLRNAGSGAGTSEIPCDHAAFLDCLGTMQECNLWVAMDYMLGSPQGTHVRRHGNADVLARLSATEDAVAKVIHGKIARGERLVDEIVPGHPLTDYLLRARCENDIL